jgi:SOS-response transcriptional repressor LexA
MDEHLDPPEEPTTLPDGPDHIRQFVRTLENMGWASSSTIGAVLRQMCQERELRHNGGFHAESRWARPGVELDVSLSDQERIRAHALSRTDVFSTQQVLRALGDVSAASARLVLGALRDKGALIHNGRRSRASRWAPADLGPDAFGAPMSKAERVREHILTRGQGHTPFTVDEVVASLPGVSQATIHKVLRGLREQGLVAHNGKRRGSRWRVLEVTHEES